MNIEEIRKNAPCGAYFYSIDDESDVTYFDKQGNYYDNDYEDWFEIYFQTPEIKPL